MGGGRDRRGFPFQRQLQKQSLSWEQSLARSPRIHDAVCGVPVQWRIDVLSLSASCYYEIQVTIFSAMDPLGLAFWPLGKFSELTNVSLSPSLFCSFIEVSFSYNNCTYLKCTVLWALIYIYVYETITRVKKMNISFNLKIFLLPLVIPPSNLTPQVPRKTLVCSEALRDNGPRDQGEAARLHLF